MLRTDLLVASWLIVLAGGVLGYATAGFDGVATAVIAVALGLGLVAGLAWAVGASVGRPSRPRFRLALAGAVAIAGWTVASVSISDPAVPFWVYAGGVAVVAVLHGVAYDSLASGLWHGVLAGGTGGVLTVFVAVYESFTMQPELTAIVLIAGIVAPLAFALAGGLGGAVGSVTLTAVRTGQVRE